MSLNTCATCLTAKANLSCVTCADAVCKHCAEFVNEDSFLLMEKYPEGILSGAHCRQCFEQNVAKKLGEYNQIVTRAENIHVYLTNQTKESRLLPRKEAKIKVEDCPDHDEALMRLAFLAARKGYNALVDVDIVAIKIRAGSYQHCLFNGTGIPSMVRSRTKRL